MSDTKNHKIKVRVAFIQYHEIELDPADYGPDTDLAEVVRDYEVWPDNPAESEVGSIFVIRPGQDTEFDWWEEIEDDIVGRALYGKKDHWLVWGEGTEQYRFLSEDAAIRKFGVVSTGD